MGKTLSKVLRSAHLEVCSCNCVAWIEFSNGKSSIPFASKSRGVQVLAEGFRDGKLLGAERNHVQMAIENSDLPRNLDRNDQSIAFHDIDVAHGAGSDDAAKCRCVVAH